MVSGAPILLISLHDTASRPVGWNVHRFDIGMRWPICFFGWIV